MKELRITVDIDSQGKITAEAEGFSGDACIRDLERLLDSLASDTESVARKPDEGANVRSAARVQRLEKKR